MFNSIDEAKGFVMFIGSILMLVLIPCALAMAYDWHKTKYLVEQSAKGNIKLVINLNKGE